jgi:hypothetical protein
VCIGWPGSMPEDQVLEKSTLHQRLAADFSVIWGSAFLGFCGFLFFFFFFFKCFDYRFLLYSLLF